MGIPMRVGWRPNPNSALSLVTSGLILNLDASNVSSYPETGTTWTDLSPTGNNGTLTNGVSYTSSNSGALTFDGINDYVDMGNNPAYNLTNISVSTWVKLTTGTPNYSPIISRYSSSGGTNYQGWLIYYSKTTSKFYVDGRESSATYLQLSSNNTYAINNWYNVTWTKSGNTWSLYINGVLDRTLTLGNGTTAFQYNNMQIGASIEWVGASETYYGKQDISTVNIYNRALTTSEVLQNYDATKSRFTSNISRLLDTYSGATAAYSLRKIRTEYTGNAITVRRSSDNTSQSIGFDANGNLDTTSLLSFVGAGNGFVSVWYDQSGNNKHVVQTTAASQPQLVVNGVVALKNAKPAIDFTSGQFLRCAQQGATNTAVSIFSVLSLKSLSSRGFAWDVGNTSGYQYFALDINTWGTSGNKFGLFISTNSDTDASTNLNQNLITLIAPNTSFATNLFANTRFHLNGTQKNISWGTGMGFPSYAGSSIITIGNSNAENVFFNGQQQEFILYSVNQTANRSAIETNINNYYTTY